MKKSKIITKRLKVKGKTFAETSLNMGFKSETGFRMAIDNSTLTPDKVIGMAVVLEMDESTLLHFLSLEFDAERLPDVTEPLLAYRKRIKDSKNPHELVSLLFEYAEELDDLIAMHKKGN